MPIVVSFDILVRSNNYSNIRKNTNKHRTRYLMLMLLSSRIKSLFPEMDVWLREELRFCTDADRLESRLGEQSPSILYLGTATMTDCILGSYL